MVQARKIIAEGCEKCPNSEDVWFHAAELNVSTLPSQTTSHLVHHPLQGLA